MPPSIARGPQISAHVTPPEGAGSAVVPTLGARKVFLLGVVSMSTNTILQISR